MDARLNRLFVDAGEIESQGVGLLSSDVEWMPGDKGHLIRYCQIEEGHG